MRTVKETARQNRRAYLWIMLMVNIVFILILMTIGLIALRVGDYLPDNTDILFIVGKNPSFDIEDGNKKSWNTDTDVDIFTSEHKNGENVSTVVSQDGTKLVAPGTLSTYKFAMYNNGNMAMAYEADIDFDLYIGGVKRNDLDFPLKVRLKTDTGKYIIGGEDEWINVKDAKYDHYVATLGASSYEGFVLELCWEFDSGNDELDTMLGTIAANEGVRLTFGINTHAQTHIDPAAEGGVKVLTEDERREVGGEMRWGWFLLLGANVGILIFYVAWILNRRLQKYERE